MNKNQKNTLHTVTIDGMTHEGNGVAKIDGFAIFIPNTAIGDVVEIRIVKVLSSYGFGIVNKIITPSTSRVEVDCSIFDKCGGCSYRHISYESELELKWQNAQDAFNRLGGFDITIDPIVASEYDMYYRNKAQFPIGYDTNNKLVYGFYAKRSHRIIKCDTCYLQPVEFSAIASNLCDFMLENKILGYDDVLKKGTIRHLFIRKATTTKQLMVCIVATTKDIPHLDKLVTFLRGKHQNIASIIVNVNAKDTNVIMSDECYTVYGNDYIIDEMCGVKVKISVLSFYQVNKLQAQKLYTKAIEYALSDETIDINILDLYCGIGTIGLSAASRAKSIMGIEIVPSAIENAKENALLNGFTNTHFKCASADNANEFLTSLGHTGDDTIVIVDPPRKGCDEDTIKALLEISPKKIVMISCNPATAARDCKLLCDNSNYTLTSCTPFDLFPRTTHVECVCLLSKIK